MSESQKLWDEFYNTHPDFMRDWKLKERISIKTVPSCHPMVTLYFDKFLEWYGNKVIDAWEVESKNE